MGIIKRKDTAKSPDRDSRFVELDWHGPRLIDEALPEHLQTSGVYMFQGYDAVHGQHALLYIGSASHLPTRFNTHRKKEGKHKGWLRDEWEVRCYFAKVPAELCRDVEKLLVWAHRPASNASGLAACKVRNLRIWNYGVCPRLFPDVSAAHPWFRPSRPLPPRNPAPRGGTGRSVGPR